MGSTVMKMENSGKANSNSKQQAHQDIAMKETMDILSDGTIIITEEGESDEKKVQEA